MFHSRSWSKWLPFSLPATNQQQRMPTRPSKSNVYLSQDDSSHHGMLVTPEFDYPIQHSKHSPQNAPPDLSSPSCSSSSNDHNTATTHSSSSYSSDYHTASTTTTVNPSFPNSPPSSYRPPPSELHHDQKRIELIRALHDVPAHPHSPPSLISPPPLLSPDTPRRARKLRKSPPQVRSTAIFPLTELSRSHSLSTSDEQSPSADSHQYAYAYSDFNDTDTYHPPSRTASRNRYNSGPPPPVLPDSPQPPSTASARTSVYSHTALLSPSRVPRQYPLNPPSPPPRPRARKLSKRRPPPALRSQPPPATGFVHAISDPTPRRSREKTRTPRKATSEHGHGGHEGVEVDVMEWIPPSTHQKWHERSSAFLSPPVSPSLRTHTNLPAPSSRMSTSESTNALSAFAWTGVSASRTHTWNADPEELYDPYATTPYRWTLATALTDEGVTDEVLVAELERMRQGGEDVDPDADEPEGVERWKTARRAMLCCRELVRTERRYLEGLRTLLSGETATTPPPLMYSYLPALLHASEALLVRLEDDPSAWGVSAAFIGAEEELESTLTAWCGVVGEFFASTSPTSPTTVRTPGTGPRSGETTSMGMWRKSMPEVRGAAKLAKEMGGRRKSEGAPVRDLAILPTQRVMRYVLLYRDLLAHTPSASPSRALVENALEVALRIAQKCDRAQGNAAFFLRAR